ncbi:MAG: hypothetical protein ACP5D2_02180, partial [Candidatus Nanoarchaeia archaeon]
MDKKGDEKYYIIISMILGIVILGLSLYFIFHEYFTEDDINWETCRQSVVMRAMSPDLEDLGKDLKGPLPLKCKTDVLVVEDFKKEEIYPTIANAIARTWYGFGEGEYDFISR